MSDDRRDRSGSDRGNRGGSGRSGSSRPSQGSGGQRSGSGGGRSSGGRSGSNNDRRSSGGQRSGSGGSRSGGQRSSQGGRSRDDDRRRSSGGSGGRSGGGRDDRRPDGRSKRGRPDDGRSGGGGSSRGKYDDRRSGGGGSSRGKYDDRRSGGGGSNRGKYDDRRSGGRSRGRDDWRDDRRDDRPLTAAEQRAAEVRARRGPRPPRSERPVTPPDNQLDEWIDEGSVRDAAVAATGRASAPARPRKEPQPLDPEIGAEMVDALGSQRGQRLSERLAQASEALDRERFDEARRISSSIAKEAPTVAAVQEVLGLSSYRLGRYKPALRALLAAQDLRSDPALLPVVADCYRALQRWDSVERTWNQIKAASPPHEIMAEGRIVMAGSLADRGDLDGAIQVMDPTRKAPKRVRDHHLREWYVLGDLYDRLGDPIAARSWFQAVADHDPDVADVADRLRALGR